MKIAIIGVGAMGSVYAGLLASAKQPKHEVWAIDTWKEHVDAIIGAKKPETRVRRIAAAIAMIGARAKPGSKKAAKPLARKRTKK